MAGQHRGWLKWGVLQTVLAVIVPIALGGLLTALGVLGGHFYFWKVLLFLCLIFVVPGVPALLWFSLNDEHTGSRRFRNVATPIAGLLCIIFALWCLIEVLPASEPPVTPTGSPMAARSQPSIGKSVPRDRLHVSKRKPTPVPMRPTFSTPMRAEPENTVTKAPIVIKPSLRPSPSPTPTLRPSPSPTPFRQSLLYITISGSPAQPDQIFVIAQYTGTGIAEDVCIWGFPIPENTSPTQRITIGTKTFITERFRLGSGGRQNTISMGAYERQVFGLPVGQPTLPIGNVYVYTSYRGPDGVYEMHEDAFTESGTYFIPEALVAFPWRSDLVAAAHKMCQPLPT
jgi:hypothetical protein